MTTKLEIAQHLIKHCGGDVVKASGIIDVTIETPLASTHFTLTAAEFIDLIEILNDDE